MRFVSWNVNGIRAAIRKGIDEYFESMDADIIMLQEVRALPEQLPKGWSWPSGSNKAERQEFKESWMEEWRAFIKPYLASESPVIVCGDLNIAHTEDDIWNPKGNAKSSGFLPQEREWFTQLLSDGWHDAFRGHVGEGEKIYSWWSNRGQARALNRGWRIDYFLLNPVAAAMIKDVQIIRQGGIDVSDHAPVILDLDF